MADNEPAAKRPSVFILYAREDDEAFVARLHDDLNRRSIDVWWDRKAMESRGRTFLQEIRDAIESVDKVIAVVGPEAVASDYVGYEWAHASLFAKTVVPVLRLGDYDLIPEAILPETGYGLAEDAPGRRHGEDFRDDGRYNHALDRLVEILEAPVPDLGPLDGTPALPPHFLPRRDDIKRLQDTVLADVNRPTVITSAKQTVALQGMGGIGKSVLAAAFARTISTRRALDDGVVWLTAGQEASERTMLANMIDLGAALGDETAAYTNRQTPTTRLSQLLRDKTCLIVLDDVWSLEQIEPFRDALGPRCRLLMTTRDGGLVTACDAQEHSVDVLSDEMSLALLSDWSEQEVADLPAQARAAARECGNLPLALAMVGAMCRGKPDRWDNALHRLRTADLEKLKRQFPNYPYPDLLRAIEASVNALEPDVRARYLDFAVFPEDTPIPEAALATFWEREGLDKYDSQDVIDTLVGLSLAGRDERGWITLHDLQRDYVRKQVENVPALHFALVDAYRAKCKGGWTGGLDDDDGYFFQFLPYHLAGAGLGDELRALLLDYEWIAAKLKATGVQAVIADYDLAGDDEAARLVQGALRLSAHVLAKDFDQLAGQLTGRVRGIGSPELEGLMRRASQCAGRPWLRPETPSLTPPGGPLLRTLEGHAGVVSAVGVLADGRRALSGSSDTTLRLWDLETEKSLRTLEGHTDDVTAVAVLVDGRRAVSASDDCTLRLWDLETGESLRTLEGHTDDVTAVAVLVDGRRAVSASDDCTLRLWDLETGESLHTIKGHTDYVSAVAVLVDGRRAVSASDDCTLRLWDLETGESLRTLEGHTDRVMAVAVLADGRRALSASDDCTLRLWDLETGESLRTLEGHTDRVMAVAVLADGRRALSASDDCTLRLWDLETGESLRTIIGHTDYVSAVAVLVDGRCALSGSWDNTLRLWDLEAGESLQTLEGHTDMVTAVEVLADGRRALSGSSGGTLRLWDLETEESLRTLGGHTGAVHALAVLADGRRALSGSDDETLRLWDVQTGESLRTLEGHTGWVSAVAVLADGRHALSGSRDNTLRLWDLEAGESLRTINGHTGPVRAVAVLADGRCAVSGSFDRTLRLWDLETGESLRTLEGHTNSVDAVALLADGRHALSGSWDKTLRLWDLETGESLRILEGHAGGVNAVAVLADGRRAVSGSGDNTLRLWDLESGETVAAFSGDGAIGCVAVAGDDVFVAGAANGAVHILRLIE